MISVKVLIVWRGDGGINGVINLCQNAVAIVAYRVNQKTNRERMDRMGLTIMEVLQNADYNIRHHRQLGMEVSSEQLHNAVVLLGKGYDVHDEIDPLLEKYGTVENVPEREE